MGIPLYFGSEAARIEAETLLAKYDEVRETQNSDARKHRSPSRSPTPELSEEAIARAEAEGVEIDRRRARRPPLRIRLDEEGRRVVSALNVEEVRRYHDEQEQELLEMQRIRREREGDDPNNLDDERSSHYLVTNSRGYTLDDLTTAARDRDERRDLANARRRDEIAISSAIIIPPPPEQARHLRYQDSRLYEFYNPDGSERRRLSSEERAEQAAYLREQEESEGRASHTSYSDAARRGLEGGATVDLGNGTAIPPFTTVPGSSSQNGPPAGRPTVFVPSAAPSAASRAAPARAAPAPAPAGRHRLDGTNYATRV
ncbi:hypothetical protein KEM54_000576, partial [Ascosphaera aggregata]